MKKVLIIIGVIVIIGFFFVLRGTNDDVTSDQDTNTTGETSMEASGYTRSEAEALLDISLPTDSTIRVIIDNDLAVGVLGNTDTPIDDLQTFFEGEMAKGSYTISRRWGILPTDNAALHTATYTGSGETWAVILRDENGTRTFDLQRQF